MMFCLRGVPTILNNDKYYQFINGTIYPMRGTVVTPNPVGVCVGPPQIAYAWIE